MTHRPKLYDLHDDVYIPDRWHLRMPLYEEEGQEELFNVGQFKEGQLLTLNKPVRISLKPPGMALEFSHAFGIPIVHHRVVSLFERLGLHEEVQFIPVEVEGQIEPWFILNALRIIPCIDEARCEEVVRWLPEDNRPDKMGGYRNVSGLKVDPERTAGARIFRPWGWKVVLIVSESLKQALEQEGITGTRFVEV